MGFHLPQLILPEGPLASTSLAAFKMKQNVRTYAVSLWQWSRPGCLLESTGDKLKRGKGEKYPELVWSCSSVWNEAARSGSAEVTCPEQRRRKDPQIPAPGPGQQRERLSSQDAASEACCCRQLACLSLIPFCCGYLFFRSCWKYMSLLPPRVRVVLALHLESVLSFSRSVALHSLYFFPFSLL